MRGLKRSLGLVLVLAAALSLGGCGYTFTGQGTLMGPDPDAVSRLDPAFRHMAIARVENPSIEPWIEPRLRSLIRDEFTRRRFVTWVDKDKATSLLTVTIKKFMRSTVVAGQQDQSVKLSTGLTMIFRVQRAGDGAVLWDSGEQSQTESFFPGDSDGADLRVTDLAVRRMADLMTENY
ncbi:MAG: LPS assembly lipoprotein LptE [Humidesulfovibrio sp.]|nr:LPS assembly lipoprotein LptE [Humidesulfovibrio sp.]